MHMVSRRHDDYQPNGAVRILADQACKPERSNDETIRSDDAASGEKPKHVAPLPDMRTSVAPADSSAANARTISGCRRVAGSWRSFTGISADTVRGVQSLNISAVETATPGFARIR